MRLRNTFEFELEIMDVIEDVILHPDSTATILIRRSNVNPKSDNLQITMSFEHFEKFAEIVVKADNIIESRLSDAKDERRTSHAG